MLVLGSVAKPDHGFFDMRLSFFTPKRIHKMRHHTMEKWKHIKIYPPFFEVLYTLHLLCPQPNMPLKLRKHIFWFTLSLVVFLAHPRKNTSTWQNFVRLRIPNLVRISISLAIASPSSCSSDQNWSYHEKKCLVMNLEVLGFLGRSFFL